MDKTKHSEFAKEKLKRMTNQDIARTLLYCSNVYGVEQCALCPIHGDFTFVEYEDLYCSNLLMKESADRLFRWNPNVNNEFFKEKCE